LPAIGAKDSLPGECCVVMKSGEVARSGGCRRINEGAYPGGVMDTRPHVVAWGRRAYRIGGRRCPPAVRPWSARGRGGPRRR
jgi:hypothetical protein